MRRVRTIERLLLVGLALMVGWQQWQLGQHQRMLFRLANQQNAITEAIEQQAEASRQRAEALSKLRAPLPNELFSRPQRQAPSDEASDDAGSAPQRAGRGGGMSPAARRFAKQRSAIARAKQRMGSASGEVVLDRLYDAADRMAVEEQWDDQTYDDVSLIFEDTTSSMLGLMDDFREGLVAPVDARDEVLTIRDEAHDRIAEILGEDGLEVLREYMKATGPRPSP